MNKKQHMLEQLIETYATEDVCLAFSGGVDSSLLLKLLSDAVRKTGRNVYAVTFDTRLHPACDLVNAGKVAGELGVIHHIIPVDELEQEEIRRNPVNRCYLCKKHLFQLLKSFAEEKGAGFVMDGTNEDDMHVYRPGIRALQELSVVSPLARLHITKSEVKAMASRYGLSVAGRPSSPCLATRLPYDTEIDYHMLARIGEGEAYLREIIGGNIRLRLHKDVARIEVDPFHLQEILQKRDKILARLKKLGFVYITLDLNGFQSGSMDINLNMV